ncbi:hypothetical protein ACRS6Y_17320 [Bacillus cytotoxicus]|uniref:hypothetical protein n=1 Tax=Bacillus cereus group TaxID=86661 RepID=UPI0002F5D477|nr:MULTISPECIES: hypothetical protein [Bacillus cereus group]AWC31998.1 hypothetical protein CG482_005905 [Bacillus cytotoxicus]AWC36030.1 hypothetical protein CG481_005915 [Bacillus cytotoxicus]AWC44027.1 hypothetical protein CG479_005565 [Bacillus cytotoxicus]AWC60275.1 hypothetical protein CG474_005980 [Bacillus cytotoxicus]MDH2862673.1 hypothetical protein [Bacillus cytotoxicus]
MSTKFDPPTTNRCRISPAQGYRESIIRLEKEGKTLKTIDPLIRKKGDNGTFSAMRTLVERDKAQTETC